jgi:hypothetical protein
MAQDSEAYQSRNSLEAARAKCSCLERGRPALVEQVASIANRHSA